MTRLTMFSAARSLRAVFILASLLIAGTFAAAAIADQNAPAAGPSASPSPAPQAKAAAPKQQAVARPLWTELTPSQQQALAPLASEWDRLDSIRKNKWLALGNKFPSMKPDEQQRIQERMRDWVKLSPEQRRVARESYSRAKKLNPDQKSAQWQQYQQLPEEQKKKLAAEAASRKHVATLPPASQARTKTVPPIKSAPKPVLEQSVTPQAANQSALQPSQPATK